MSDPTKKWTGWSDNEFVHPNSPRGGGGPGGFREACALDGSKNEWHPQAPVSRHCGPTHDQKQQRLLAAAAPGDQNSGLASGNPATLRDAVLSFAADHLGKPAIGKECTGLPEAALTAVGAKIARDFAWITGKKDQDYVWGKSNKDSFQPGQILQFRDHKFTKTTKVEFEITLPDGRPATFFTQDQDRKTRAPQHTAIMASDEGDGAIYVYEQHVTIAAQGDQQGNVQKNIVYTETRPPRTDTQTNVIDFSDQNSKDQFMETHGLNERQHERTYRELTALLKTHHVKKATVKVRTTTTITVSGFIWAYEPERK
jgi:hypothetical protein